MLNLETSEESFIKNSKSKLTFQKAKNSFTCISFRKYHLIIYFDNYTEKNDTLPKHYRFSLSVNIVADQTDSTIS